MDKRIAEFTGKKLLFTIIIEKIKRCKKNNYKKDYFLVNHSILPFFILW